jgi:hypothetical protein
VTLKDEIPPDALKVPVVSAVALLAVWALCLLLSQPVPAVAIVPGRVRCPCVVAEALADGFALRAEDRAEEPLP